MVLALPTVLSVGGYTVVPLVSDLGGGLIAAVLIIEGATRRCLLYGLLGIDRCSVD